MPPAPKPIALYFPQYYTFEENDRFWGEGFTEWTLLKPFTPGRGELPIRKPKPTSEGGLGYYNLLDRGTRSRQAELAKAYGVHGFCYYHYWFSGPTARSISGTKSITTSPDSPIHVRSSPNCHTETGQW